MESGEGQQREAKKPVVTSKEMKSLQWSRFTWGNHLLDCETSVWDMANLDYSRQLELLPVVELEERFCKVTNRASVGRISFVEPKVENAKVLQIPSIDSTARLNIEVIIRGLPATLNSPGKLVAAIIDLDNEVCSLDVLKSVGKYLCPDDWQAADLVAKRQETPDVPWDKIEAFMTALASIPACRQRLNSWVFLMTLSETRAMHEANVLKFAAMLDSFSSSSELPWILGLVLAFGNHLNGGKNEKRLGQADGFHIEALGRPGGVDVVKDPQGRNVRHMIFKTFIEASPERAERFIDDMAPLFVLVSRTLVKEDNGERLKKDVRVQIEEVEKEVMLFKRQFDERYMEVKEAVRLISDPSDRFREEFPKRCEEELKHVEQLVADIDKAKASFRELLRFFKAERFNGLKGKEEMTSKVWILIWDDFLVAKELIEKRPEKVRRDVLAPRFCRGAALDLEAFEILWELREAQPRRFKRRERPSDGRRFGKSHGVRGHRRPNARSSPPGGPDGQVLQRQASAPAAPIAAAEPGVARPIWTSLRQNSLISRLLAPGQRG